MRYNEHVKHGTDAKTATKLLPNVASFVAAIEAGSFTAAAKRLGVDKTLISRRVVALEEALGVRLLHRSTRRMSPTEIGRSLFEEVSQPVSTTLLALLNAGVAKPMQGVVRAATLSAFDREIWAPLIAGLIREQPGIRIETSASDDFVDLIDGGFDFALRTGRMPDSSLTTRRLARWSYVLCAAPKWIENQPSVETPQDLSGHWLLYNGVPKANRWCFESESKHIEVEMESLAASDTPELLLSLACSGVGVTALPTYFAREALANGELVRLLPTWRIDHDQSIWLVLPTRAYVPPRVRLVVEALADHLAKLEKTWMEFA